MSSPDFYRPQALANVLAARLRSYSSPDNQALSSYIAAGKDGPAMLECLITEHGSKLSSIQITDTHRTSLIQSLIKCGNPDLLDLGIKSMSYQNINWSNIIEPQLLLEAWSRPRLLATLAQQEPTNEAAEYNYPLMFYMRMATTSYLNPKFAADHTWIDVLDDIEMARPTAQVRPLLSVILPSYVDIRSDVARSGSAEFSTDIVDSRFSELLREMASREVKLDASYQRVENSGHPHETSMWYQNALHEVLELAADSHYWLPCVNQLLDFMPWEPVLQADLSPAARQLLLAQPLVCRSLLTQVSQKVNPSPDFAKTKPKI